jgi:hypothetical protein
MKKIEKYFVWGIQKLKAISYIGAIALSVFFIISLTWAAGYSFFLTDDFIFADGLAFDNNVF